MELGDFPPKKLAADCTDDTDQIGGAMLRMMQYDPGYDDYSKEPHEIFAGITIDQLLDSIEPKPDSSLQK